MTVKLKNNVVSSLRTELLSSSTTVILPVGHGVRFPSLGAGEYIYATIEDAAGNYEIVQATARATDTLTVVRGAEGTTPRTFAAGSTIEMRVTAATVLDAASDAAGSVSLTSLGVTATSSELNILDGATLTTAELNILDGATLSTAELNILDGVTATTAELNILDGVTATTAELNKLAGTPAGLTATELGYVDGVTSSIQTQLDGKQAADATLAALAAYNANGLLAQTAPDTFVGRAIDGTANQITVTNASGVGGNPTISAVIASPSDAATGSDNVKLITSLGVRNAVNATGTAPIYAARAWVNFSGVQQTGTYSRTGTLVTVTISGGHGMLSGMIANLDFTSGTATDGSYTVNVLNATQFTVNDTVSGATTGNVTINLYIRAAGNVASITDNGVGDYTLNFATALPNAYYVPNITVCGPGLTSTALTGVVAGTTTGGANLKTATQLRIQTGSTAAGVLADVAEINVSILR